MALSDLYFRFCSTLSRSEPLTSRRRLWQAMIGFLSTGLFCYLALQHVAWPDLHKAIASAQINGLVLAGLGLSAAYLLRGCRWQWCFPEDAHVGWGSAFSVLMMGYMGNNLLPARGGELLRAHYLGRITHQNRTGVLATIVLERILDGVVLSLCLGLGWALTQDLELPWGFQWVVAGFLAGAIGVLLLIFGGPQVRHWLERQTWLPGQSIWHGFVQGLDALRSPWRLGAILVLSGLIWSLELVGFGGMLVAFQLPLQANIALFFMTVANFASLVPAAPAGWGTVEHFTTEFLVLLGLDRETILAMVFSQHLIYFGITTLVGLGCWLAFQLRQVFHGSPSDGIDQAPPDLETPFSETPLLTKLEVKAPTLTAPPTLSIVLPAKNEAHRILRTLEDIVAYLDQSPLGASTEIWVVDDGSDDATATVIKTLQLRVPQLGLISYQPNCGKGHAVQTGILYCRGEQVLMADADGATPIHELDRLLPLVSEQCPVVIGSRVLTSPDTQIQTLLHRKLIGWVFIRLVQWLAVSGIQDTQCGFKLLHRSVALDLAQHLTIQGFGFDVELLFIAQQRGYRIQEVPINWINQPGSKVRLIRDSWRMLLDMLSVRWKHQQGIYNRFRQTPSPSLIQKAGSLQTVTKAGLD